MPNEVQGQANGNAVVIDSVSLAREINKTHLGSELRPPVFKGLAGDDVEQWLHRFTVITKAIEWDDARRLLMVPVFLDGFAASWWKKVSDNGNKQPYADWAAFKTAVQARFQTDDYKNQVRRQLAARRMVNGEKLEDYFNDVMALCDKVDSTMGDEKVIDKLRAGLLPELLLRCAMSKATTPMEFLSDLQRASDNMRLESKNRKDYHSYNTGQGGSTGSGGVVSGRAHVSDANNQGRGGGTVWRGGKKGHWSGKYRNGDSNRDETTTASTTSAGTGPGGGGSRGGRPQDRPAIQCYNCGSPHKIRQCPKNKAPGGNSGAQAKSAVVRHTVDKDASWSSWYASYYSGDGTGGSGSGTCNVMLAGKRYHDGTPKPHEDDDEDDESDNDRVSDPTSPITSDEEEDAHDNHNHLQQTTSAGTDHRQPELCSFRFGFGSVKAIITGRDGIAVNFTRAQWDLVRDRLGDWMAPGAGVPPEWQVKVHRDKPAPANLEEVARRYGSRNGLELDSPQSPDGSARGYEEAAGGSRAVTPFSGVEDHNGDEVGGFGDTLSNYSYADTASGDFVFGADYGDQDSSEWSSDFPSSDSSTGATDTDPPGNTEEDVETSDTDVDDTAKPAMQESDMAAIRGASVIPDDESYVDDWKKYTCGRPDCTCLTLAKRSGSGSGDSNDNGESEQRTGAGMTGRPCATAIDDHGYARHAGSAGDSSDSGYDNSCHSNSGNNSGTSDEAAGAANGRQRWRTISGRRHPLYDEETQRWFEPAPSSVAVWNALRSRATAKSAIVPPASHMPFGGAQVPQPISFDVPIIELEIAGRRATALVDTGASLSIINISFVRGLGENIQPHVTDVTVADNRVVRTCGLVPLDVRMAGLGGVVPFVLFDSFGSVKYDAVLGCNVLATPGISVHIGAPQVVRYEKPTATTGQKDKEMVVIGYTTTMG